MIARKFPGDHPRKGEYTKFYGKINDSQKIHTIRGNYELWAKRIREVQEGKALLELREWVGKPYRSKQREIFTFSAADGVGVEKLIWGYFPTVGTKQFHTDEIAENDGLSALDFENWFKVANPGDELAIIHFTKFRYNG